MRDLIEVQAKLKAPKNQFNNFGKYNYRSCEDILEGVKPLLKEHGLILTISDKVVEVGGRVYVEATAKIRNSENSEIAVVTAYAREAEIKKGMDEAQVTGSASSYARKYALNGLFLIDDTKDSDTHDNSDSKSSPEKIDFEIIKEKISAMSIDEMMSYWAELDPHFTSDKQRKAVSMIFTAAKKEREGR